MFPPGEITTVVVDAHNSTSGATERHTVKTRTLRAALTCPALYWPAVTTHNFVGARLWMGLVDGAAAQKEEEHHTRSGTCALCPLSSRGVPRRHVFVERKKSLTADAHKRMKGEDMVLGVYKQSSTRHV